MSQGRELKRPIQMCGEQFGRTALLPRCKTATILAPGPERRRVGVSHVRTKEQAEIVQKERALWRLKRRHDHQGHSVQDRIDTAMCACEGPNPRCLRISSECVEEGARNGIVDPVHRTAVAHTRI